MVEPHSAQAVVALCDLVTQWAIMVALVSVTVGGTLGAWDALLRVSPHGR